jgi:hypothetical protein
MKRNLLLAVLAFAAAGLPHTAGAQTQQPYDKWCRDQGISRGSVQICWGYTFEQCMDSRTSHTETCYLNPIYDPRFAEWRKRNPHR